MRLPNSYGSVYKLSGKRRKPWAVRKTVGWKQIPEKMRSYPIYQFVGYYATKAEALQALADYNKDPYDLKLDTITFAEVYQRWSDVHFEKVKVTRGYKASFAISKPLHNMRIADIKLAHLQKVVNESGKNTPALTHVKNLWSLMWDYAVMHEIIPADRKNIVRYVDVSMAGNPNARAGKAFSKEDVQALWDASNENEVAGIALMLIYTGLRIGELLELKKEDVHLDERWFFVRSAKTTAGVREVPIAEKIVPFFQCWMKKDSPYLICTKNGKPYSYHNFSLTCWEPTVQNLLSCRYTPHSTRHTCISLLTEAGVDERVIKQIVGHKGTGVTQAVYTHLSLKIKLEAVNKI